MRFLPKSPSSHPNVLARDRKYGIPRLCSILVPAYNAEKWLNKCLESLLKQTYGYYEIIIVDDGSTDRTLEIAKSFSQRDGRIQIFRHEENTGEWAARNTALKHAQGEYIAWQDADDWSAPERIEKCIARLNRNPICDIVTGGTVWTSGVDSGILDLGGRRGLIPEDYLAGRSGVYPCNPSIVTRREIYELVGDFPHIEPYGTDSVWDICSIMAGCRWAHLPENLYFYRRHPESMLHSSSQDKAEAVRQIRVIRDVEYEKWMWPYFIHRNLDVMTNGSCNLDCPACNQVPYRREYQHYQMSMAEVEKICQSVVDNGKCYEHIGFSGGEPMLWKNLEAACKLVKRSGAAKKVRIFSNCYDTKRLMAALDANLIDHIYSSVCNVIPENVSIVMSKYPERIKLGGMQNQVWLPNGPLPDALPAKCTCDRFTVIENNVYPCGAFFSHTKRLGRKLEDYKDFYCSLDDDWVSFFRGVDYYNMDICRYCLNNDRVYPRLPVAEFPHWPAGMLIPKPKAPEVIIPLRKRSFSLRGRAAR